jgi:tetratricopeptide (TPR) repeat protein
LKLQARALELLGDRQAALDSLAKGLKDNPDDPEMLGLAASLAARGSYDRPLAITYYQRLFQVTRDPLTRRQLVELLISLNRFPEAIPLQEEEVAQFPNDSEALHNLALLHYWQRDYQAAGRIFQRLLEKAAEDAALRLEAARNAEAGQQLDQALAHYLWLYSRSRGEKEYALALARLWARKGNHAEAAGVVAPLMQENPDFELRRQYALELLLIGDLPGALKAYQGVEGSNPLVPTIIWRGLQEVGNRGVVSLFALEGNVYHFFTTGEVIEQIYRVSEVFLGKVGIAHGHFQVRMAQEFLHRLQAGSPHHQPGSKCVSEIVKAKVFYPGPAAS